VKQAALWLPLTMACYLHP